MSFSVAIHLLFCTHLDMYDIIPLPPHLLQSPPHYSNNIIFFLLQELIDGGRWLWKSVLYNIVLVSFQNEWIDLWPTCMCVLKSWVLQVEKMFVLVTHLTGCALKLRERLDRDIVAACMEVLKTLFPEEVCIEWDLVRYLNWISGVLVLLENAKELKFLLFLMEILGI